MAARKHSSSATTRNCRYRKETKGVTWRNIREIKEKNGGASCRRSQCSRASAIVVVIVINNTMNHHQPSNERGLEPTETEGGSGRGDGSGDPKVLLPTKVHHHPQDDGRSLYRAYPNTPVQWTAQPVMDWLETLALATEDAEAAAAQNSNNQDAKLPQPIMIDGVQLSEVCPRPSAAKVWSTAQPKQTSGLWVHPTENPSFEKHEVSQNGWEQTPIHWNAYFLHERDPLAWMYTRQMSRLAVRIESMRGADLATYQMVQTRLEFTFGRILGQFPYGTTTDCVEMRSLLNTLYTDTIQKLQELVDKAAEPKNPDQTKSTGIEHCGTACNEINPLETPSAPPSLNKKDLQKYMTAWLRDNWTNPYPDDDGLAEMARECGTSTTQVSNWLINARTRKWRPAIIKATQMDRPSSMLLEDSVNIFDNKPVRNIHPCPQNQGGGHPESVANKRLKTDHYMM